MAKKLEADIQHNVEIHENLQYWNDKPLLREIYGDFYNLIAGQVDAEVAGHIVELGSGIGNLKHKVPTCITTDIFENKWIDQTENAYKLSFENKSVSNLILFDVWHHLEYPGDVLSEFNRVLADKGRVIIFDPDMGLLGRLVYGVFHHEPIGTFKNIAWNKQNETAFEELPYYAAQGHANKIFVGNSFRSKLKDWNLKLVKRMSKLSYVASGGYSGKQLYPDNLYSAMKKIDSVLDNLPFLFSTRILVVLEKKG